MKLGRKWTKNTSKNSVRWQIMPTPGSKCFKWPSSMRTTLALRSPTLQRLVGKHHYHIMHWEESLPLHSLNFSVTIVSTAKPLISWHTSFLQRTAHCPTPSSPSCPCLTSSHLFVLKMHSFHHRHLTSSKSNSNFLTSLNSTSLCSILNINTG